MLTVRLSRRLWRYKMQLPSRIMDLLTRVIYSASIPGRAAVARSVFFHHSGLGVVINPAAVIEENCEIGVLVVLGGRAPYQGAPHLEPGVIVHAGAKLIGDIRIGAGSVIAANAVVIADVPPNSLMAGVPAVIKRSDIQSAYYQTSSRPDWNPVASDANAT